MIKISASIASLPKTELRHTIDKLSMLEVDAIHVDIEDGHFVPTQNFDVKIIDELRSITQLPLDVHLSVSDPEKIIPEVASLGADWITVHLEACPYPHRTLRLIRELEKCAGLAVNPITPLPDIKYLLPVLDIISILTTEPEYPEAEFFFEILEKVQAGRQMFQRGSVEWMIDGGITDKNLLQAISAGATILVIGRSLFYEKSIEKNLLKIREIIKKSRYG